MKRFESLCPVCRSEVELKGGMGAEVYVCPEACQFRQDDVIIRLAKHPLAVEMSRDR